MSNNDLIQNIANNIPDDICEHNIYIPNLRKKILRKNIIDESSVIELEQHSPYVIPVEHKSTSKPKQIKKLEPIDYHKKSAKQSKQPTIDTLGKRILDI